MEKVVVIGVDGATFDVIKPLIAMGRLPNLARLLEGGVHGDLCSTIHPITPQAWSTFLTGMNAGKHGVFDFTRRKEGTYGIEFVNASRRKGDSIFLYLSRLGLRVGAMAIPFTYPPEPVNGFMLSGIDAPAEDERAVHPKELFDEIQKRFGAYYIHLASPVGRSNDEVKFYKDIVKEDKNRTDIGLHLMEHYSSDLFMTVYNNTDRVQHQYLTYEILEALNNGDEKKLKENLLVKTYENTDKEIGRLLEAIDKDTTLFLMSDHGSGPIKRVFFLNRWLEENGYLTYRSSDSKRFHLLEKLRYFAKRLLPRWVKGFIKSVLPQVRDKVESYRFFTEIDWDKTAAFGFGNYGNIYINLSGREPQGTVPGKDYERFCGEIAEKLGDLRDPDTGERLIKEVCFRKKLYNGPCSNLAPDLVIHWNDYSYYTSTTPGKEKGSCFGSFLKIDSSDFDHVGTHRLNGMFVAFGKKVRKDTVINGAHIADVAPTILFAMGQPIPEEMDGKVLTDIFTGDFLGKNSPKYVASKKGSDSDTRRAVDYTEEESERIKERLKGLGYM